MYMCVDEWMGVRLHVDIVQVGMDEWMDGCKSAFLFVNMHIYAVK